MELLKFNTMPSQVNSSFNETFNNVSSQHDDYFHSAFENELCKWASILSSVPFFFLIASCLYGIIWYDRYGSDDRRILLNRLFTSISWAGLEYYSIAAFVDILRYIVGPLPKVICLCQLILKNSIQTRL